MSKHEESRYELHHELEKGLGQRGTIMLMEELQAIREDVRHLSVKMDAVEARLEARFLRTILMVNIPSILGAVGLAFAATRVG
jgi:hypothetical protein